MQVRYQAAPRSDRESNDAALSRAGVGMLAVTSTRASVRCGETTTLAGMRALVRLAVAFPFLLAAVLAPAPAPPPRRAAPGRDGATAAAPPAAAAAATTAPLRALGETGPGRPALAIPDAWVWWVEPNAPADLDGGALVRLCTDLAAAGAPALSLAGCTRLRGADLAPLASVTSLRHLDLAGCTSLGDEAATTLRALPLEWVRADDTSLPTDLGRRSAAIFTRAEQERTAQDLVGLAIVVVADGRIAYAAGHGFADLVKKTLVRPAVTSFRWASISKPVTAVAALQLVELQALDLDADVRTLVLEFPAKPWPITTRQLLTHQGGVVHYGNGEVIATQRSYDTEHPFVDLVVALDKFKESPLICEPGSAHHYTTHGFMLAGAAVERAGKAPFWEQVRQRIAVPLGMTSFQPDYEWLAIPDRTRGYRKLVGVIAPSADVDVSWKLAGGGFTSTAIDLARFGQGLLQGALLQPATQAAMFTAQKTRDGKRTTYGLGIGTGRLGEHATVSHSGAQDKTRTFLLLVPERQVAVAVMCNSEWAQLADLTRDLARLAID